MLSIVKKIKKIKLNESKLDKNTERVQQPLIQDTVKEDFRKRILDQAINYNKKVKYTKPIDENTEGALLYNRTIIVGPSFCGKRRLLLNKLKLIRLCDSENNTYNCDES